MEMMAEQVIRRPTKAQVKAMKGIAESAGTDDWASQWPGGISSRTIESCVGAGWLEKGTTRKGTLPFVAYRLTPGGWQALTGRRATGRLAIMLQMLLNGPTGATRFRYSTLHVGERTGWIETAPTPAGSAERYIQITDEGRAALPPAQMKARRPE